MTEQTEVNLLHIGKEWAGIGLTSQPENWFYSSPAWVSVWAEKHQSSIKASYCAIRMAFYLCCKKVLKQAKDATSFHVEISDIMAAVMNRSQVFSPCVLPSLRGSSSNCLLRRVISSNQEMPRNIHLLPLPQFSICHLDFLSLISLSFLPKFFFLFSCFSSWLSLYLSAWSSFLLWNLLVLPGKASLETDSLLDMKTHRM